MLVGAGGGGVGLLSGGGMRGLLDPPPHPTSVTIASRVMQVPTLRPNHVFATIEALSFRLVDDAVLQPRVSPATQNVSVLSWTLQP